MRISVALSVGSLLMITNLIFYVIASVIYNTKIAQTDMSSLGGVRHFCFFSLACHVNVNWVTLLYGQENSTEQKRLLRAIQSTLSIAGHKLHGRSFLHHTKTFSLLLWRRANVLTTLFQGKLGYLQWWDNGGLPASGGCGFDSLFLLYQWPQSRLDRHLGT